MEEHWRTIAVTETIKINKLLQPANKRDKKKTTTIQTIVLQFLQQNSAQQKVIDEFIKATQGGDNCSDLHSLFMQSQFILKHWDKVSNKAKRKGKGKGKKKTANKPMQTLSGQKITRRSTGLESSSTVSQTINLSTYLNQSGTKSLVNLNQSPQATRASMGLPNTQSPMQFKVDLHNTGAAAQKK